MSSTVSGGAISGESHSVLKLFESAMVRKMFILPFFSTRLWPGTRDEPPGAEPLVCVGDYNFDKALSRSSIRSLISSMPVE